MLLLNLISYTIIMSITPGPNNIICLTLGSQYGYKVASKYILGVVLGCLTMQWLMLLLNELIEGYLPVITTYVRYIGAIYLLYLAYKIVTSRTLITEDTTDSKTNILGFKEGVILQYINPKAYIFNMTVVTGFLTTVHYKVYQYALFTLLISVLFFSCCSVWALFGHSLKRLFTDYRSMVNGVLGAVLVYIAITIVTH